MKQVYPCICAFVVVLLSSCDYSIYVGVRNHKSPTNIHVVYDTSRASNTLLPDSLGAYSLTDNSHQTAIGFVRESDSTYRFLLHNGLEVSLPPNRIQAQPIKRIKIENSDGTSQLVNLWDNKEVKKLKDAGIIIEKGFIFKNSIIIVNK